ncbi:hypothetical protein HWV62_29636 [Athelia sp. TMB]|nr:hypothetical protein HWV62_29636 [Athelia sp. TMB]
MRKTFLDRHGNTVDFDELIVELETEGRPINVKRVKEVWFAGSHSDVCVGRHPTLVSTHYFYSGGGGWSSLNNDALNIERAPLLWMTHEAAMAGLHFEHSTVEWKILDLKTRKPTRSLHTFWWALEYFPIHRQNNGRGADAIWLWTTVPRPLTKQEHREYQNLQQKRPGVLKKLLRSEDRLFLGSVKLLARLATELGKDHRKVVTEILSGYRWIPPTPIEPTTIRSRFFDSYAARTSGFGHRVVELLRTGASLRGEAANTIVDIAPNDDLRHLVLIWGVTDALVDMLSGAYATAGANALVALSHYGEATWEKILDSLYGLHSSEVNFNWRLQPPAAGDYETRDAAATIISELAGHWLTHQAITNEPWQTSSGKTLTVVDEKTISLLKKMLAVEAVSEAAANALRKLSEHAFYRSLIMKEAAFDLIGMFNHYNNGPALNAVAELIRTQENVHDVLPLILSHGQIYLFSDIAGVTPKTESLIMAVTYALKDSARESAAFILTEVVSDPAAAIVVLNSSAPNILLESLNKRDARIPLNVMESVEYDSLMNCLTTIVTTYAKLSLNAKYGKTSPPPRLSLILDENGAQLLFEQVILRKCETCRTAANVLVALSEHDHNQPGKPSNREVIALVVSRRLEEFKTHLEEMCGSTNGETVESLGLASNVASMTMLLAVLRIAGMVKIASLLRVKSLLLVSEIMVDAKLLLKTFKAFYELWEDALQQRARRRLEAATTQEDQGPEDEDEDDGNDEDEDEDEEEDKGEDKGENKEEDQEGEEEGNREHKQAPHPAFDAYDSYGEQADIIARAIKRALHSSSPMRTLYPESNVRQEFNNSDDDAKTLVHLLVKRLGSRSQDGAWSAIKELATAC